MIDGSVLQSAQRCFEKKSRVVVKMVVNWCYISSDIACTYEFFPRNSFPLFFEIQSVPIFSGFFMLVGKYVMYGKETKWLPRSFSVEGKQTVSGAFLPH